MTDEDRAEQDRLTDEFLAEWSADPDPSRQRWQALLERYAGKINVEPLLRHGAARGWLD